MRQDNAQHVPNATVPALAVHSIWHVDADASYDVTVGPWHWRRLVAIRTLAGEGELTFAHDVTVTAAAKSLVLISGPGLQRYRCPGPRWHFWWLELDVPVPVALPIQQVLAMPTVTAEKRLLRLAFAALRQDKPTRANVAAAASQLLVHLWQTQWDGTQQTSHQQTLVDRVIESMHRHLGPKDRLTVGDMAATARLSVPHFHRIFHALTGQAPKPFYDGLRLDRARQLLSQRQLNVSETAAALGFSSPFHFSRSYKKRFGLAPSHVNHPPSTP